MNALWYFRHLFARQQGRLYGALALSLVTLAAGAGLLGVSGWFLTAASLTTAGLMFNLFGPSSLVRGLSLIRILGRYGERLVGHDGTLRLLTDIRAWLFTTLFPRFPLQRQSLRHGDLVSRMTADVDALDTAFLVALSPIFGAVILGAAMTAILAVTLPGAALVYALCFAIAALLVPVVLVSRGRRHGAAIALASADLRLAVLDGIEGHADLIAFGAIGEARATLDGAAGRLARARKALAGEASLAACCVQVLAGGVLCAVLWAGIGAVKAGALDGAVMVGLLLAVLGSFEATAAIVRSVAKLGIAIAGAERLRDLAQSEPRIIDVAHPVELPEASDIVFEGVRFGYDPARPVLDGLDLSVRQGERVAVIGASGAGKSTILELLLRLYDPQAGTVCLGGADIATMRQNDLHRTIAMLSQDAPVFGDSVRNNLLIGRAGADDAALWTALTAAGLAEQVRQLPSGLDTLLDESGRTLSAGEARRLCLARVLMSQAPVIVLDEPTSGLDRDTELQFFADLPTATAGRTVLLITHAAIPEGIVDRIVTLSEGTVFERQVQP